MKTIDEGGEASAQAGFSVLDDKGRVSLPKTIRKALGIQSGSSLAYILLDDAVLLIPQDEHLKSLQQQAVEALTEAGLTVQDILDQLPQAREEVLREAYGQEFLTGLRQSAVERSEPGDTHGDSVEENPGERPVGQVE